MKNMSFHMKYEKLLKGQAEYLHSSSSSLQHPMTQGQMSRKKTGLEAKDKSTFPTNMHLTPGTDSRNS